MGAASERLVFAVVVSVVLGLGGAGLVWQLTALHHNAPRASPRSVWKKRIWQWLPPPLMLCSRRMARGVADFSDQRIWAVRQRVAPSLEGRHGNLKHTTLERWGAVRGCGFDNWEKAEPYERPRRTARPCHVGSATGADGGKPNPAAQMSGSR